MTEQNNIDHIIDLQIDNSFNESLIRFKLWTNNYPLSFKIIRNPTANCQLSSASNIGDRLKKLNKYQIRNLFIKIRKSGSSKRVLLLDIHQNECLHLKESIARSAIIGNLPYISTNGSEMEIILIKLNSIRQLKLPTLIAQNEI